MSGLVCCLFILFGVICAPVIPPKEGLCPPRDQWADKCPPGLHFHCVSLLGFNKRSVQNCYLYHIPKGTYLKQTVVNGKVKAWPATCPNDTFSPDEDWSNTTTLRKSCKSKTTCKEEGEYVIDNGTISTDRRCACRFEEGWVSYSGRDTFTDNDPLPDCYPVSCPAGKELKNGRQDLCLPCDDQTFKKEKGFGNCTSKKKCRTDPVSNGNTTHDRICEEDISISIAVTPPGDDNLVNTSPTKSTLLTSTINTPPNQGPQVWTTKDILITFFSTAGFLLTVAGFVLAILVVKDYRQIRQRLKTCCCCICIKFYPPQSASTVTRSTNTSGPVANHTDIQDGTIPTVSNGNAHTTVDPAITDQPERADAATSTNYSNTPGPEENNTIRPRPRAQPEIENGKFPKVTVVEHHHHHKHEHSHETKTKIFNIINPTDSHIGCEIKQEVAASNTKDANELDEISVPNSSMVDHETADDHSEDAKKDTDTDNSVANSNYNCNNRVEAPLADGEDFSDTDDEIHIEQHNAQEAKALLQRQTKHDIKESDYIPLRQTAQ